METIDARGQACPLPVVRAKRALSEMGEGALEVLVDNETAVRNLEALAKTLKCACSSERRGEAQFAVRIEKGAADGVEAAEGDRRRRSRPRTRPATARRRAATRWSSCPPNAWGRATTSSGARS